MTQLHRHAPDPGPMALTALLVAIEENAVALPPFSIEAVGFFSALSDRLMRHPGARDHPDLLALAYWMRRSELMRLRERFAHQPAGTLRVPQGLAFHVPPANVDTMFVYSWILSSLVGNRNVIRLSPRAHTPGITLLLALMNELLAQPEHAAMRAATWVVGYGHDDEANRALSARCDVRLLWGGDAAVEALRAFPLASHAHELTFVDRFSMAAIRSEAYMTASQTTRDALARSFYNDAYWFDQRGCASPRLVVWCGDPAVSEAASMRFFEALEAIVEEKGYRPETALSLQKQLAACQACLDLPVHRHRRFGAGVTVLSIATWAEVREVAAGGGLFFEVSMPQLADLVPHVRRRDQTLAHFGFATDELEALARSLNGRGLDRFVPIGQALSFQPVWDGVDLLQALSRVVSIQPSMPETTTVALRFRPDAR